MLLIKKGQFFVYLVLVKTRLVKRFNNVLDRKETFFKYKKKKFSKSKNLSFLKGLTHAFGQKMQDFSLFGIGQNKTRKNA